MNHCATVIEIDPYSLLRASLALFQKTPSELDERQLTQARDQALKEHAIENRVLRSPEAAAVIVSERTLAKAVQEIRERFPDEQSFVAALEHNGLDKHSLQSAMLRQCKVENVLEKVAARASTVSEVEIGIYYHLHPEKFHRPEQRGAKHILITINEEFPENSRANAWQRICDIAARLKQKPHKFADLALKYSECPTALQGGELGTFGRGQLFPQIEAVLFGMKEKQISDVIETEAGFHIVQCGKIHGAETISLKKAQSKIRQLMQERARRTCQRTWLASLPVDRDTLSTIN
ncbi:nitrogen fixation protein NifM [Methylomarinum vadi]|uniref:nitrogen fixation protein NifM n=1 Tax=Methylomarinum vadi TaxID=438855 RepID=UPI0004DF372B|nr:nitrogen fixation protein NifM [Methylomarinum vadi]